MGKAKAVDALDNNYPPSSFLDLYFQSHQGSEFSSREKQEMAHWKGLSLTKMSYKKQKELEELEALD